MRSAIAPETIVAAVAANANWKIQPDQSSKAQRKKWPSPKKLFDDSPFTPYATAQPMAQKASAPMETSMMFFIRMFAVFFARTNPASSMAKPACMKNTRNAAISSHAVSIAAIRSAICSSVSWALVLETSAIAPNAPASTASSRRYLSNRKNMTTSFRLSMHSAGRRFRSCFGEVTFSLRTSQGEGRQP